MIYIVGISFVSGAVIGIVFLSLLHWVRKEKFLRMKELTRDMFKKAKEEVDQERRETLARLKNEVHKKRSEFDLEKKKDRIEIQRLQHKHQKKLDSIERREEVLDDLRSELQSKERSLAKRLDILSTDEMRLKKVYADLVHKLERLSSVKREEAKRILFDSLKEEVKLESQKWIAKVEEETKITAKEKSSRILISTMQRYLADQVTLHSSSVIQLPNEEMKGRIIGKEGRNIKALEMSTGMEFVIGDTPEVITISGFNPIRREIAKRALSKLIQDGRINPTRIEETVKKCEDELDDTIIDIGQQAVLEFEFSGMHEELIKLIGSLHFRASFTQNVLVHSKEVAYFARMVANELGLDSQLAARCGLLHDIGKAVSAEIEGPHAVIGGDLAKKFGENAIIVNAIASHHDDASPKTIYALITQIADAVSASRPGARRETLATYLKRLEQLEEISSGFDGVKRAYALQAGREIRVIVDETTLDDEKAQILARDIAKRIEEEMSFPGEIKVNVIREKRIIEYAR
jgi:ribonuclease Y